MKEKRTTMLTVPILPVLQRTVVMMVRLVKLGREREVRIAVVAKKILGHCLVIGLKAQTRR